MKGILDGVEIDLAPETAASLQAPHEEVNLSREIPTREWILRIGIERMGQIKVAALQSGDAVAVGLMDYALAEVTVDLASERLQGGVALLRAKGLITEYEAELLLA
jgi:hypothetical protein